MLMKITITSTRSEEDRFYGSIQTVDIGKVTTQETTSGWQVTAEKEGEESFLTIRDLSVRRFGVEYPKWGDPDWQRMIKEAVTFTVTGSFQTPCQKMLAAKKAKAAPAKAAFAANEAEIIRFIEASYAVGSNPLPHLRSMTGGTWVSKRGMDGLMVYHKETQESPVWRESK